MSKRSGSNWTQTAGLFAVAIVVSAVAAVSLLALASPAAKASPLIAPPGQVRFGVAILFGPPEIPVYEQPVCPGDGYMWTPGYWYWDDDVDDYYWVPGTWVMAPEPGFLWTPGYWGWGGDRFVFYDGYWGPQVGFYGGINYGFGYFGRGFEGGRWDGGRFFYNRAVMNVNVNVIHNVYNTRVENNFASGSRVSYNGGTGGIEARATAQEEAAARERHIERSAEQTRNMEAARGNQQFRASVNHGRPAVAASSRPGEFSGHEVVGAKSGGNYNPNRGGAAPGREENRPPGNPARGGSPVHVRELPPQEKMPAPNTGDTKRDQKYQQQQQKLEQKQAQERQKLQQKQDQEHQRAEQQHANDTRKQQMEQRHQQQTQQMQQRHTQQRQQIQQKQQPPPAKKH
jgi:hypothetical protein